MAELEPYAIAERGEEEWQRFLDDSIRDIQETIHAPGIAFVLRRRDHSEMIGRALGLAEIERAVPLTIETPVRAGSISKLITAIAVQQQVEKGNLDLDQEIGEYVGWPLPFGYGGATLRDLLTHRSGIGERFARQSFPSVGGTVDLNSYLKTSLPPPVASVGATITYSNFGISLAALAVESVTQRRFYEYAADEIFSPLRMVRSTFVMYTALEAETARGYNWIFGGHRELPLRHWRPYPASSLVTTMREMGLLMQWLLDNCESAVLREPACLLTEQTTAVNGLPGMALSFWLDELYDQPVAWHTGHMPGHRTGFYLFPKAGFGVVLYYNTDTKVLRDFLERVARFAIADRSDRTAKVSEAVSSDFRKYSGTYRHSWYPHHHFGKSSAFLGKEGEEVVVQAAADSLLIAGQRYDPAEDGVFERAAGGMRLGFIRGSRDRITGLYLGGRDRYERLASWETSSSQIRLVSTAITGFILYAVVHGVLIVFDSPFAHTGTAWAIFSMSAVNLSFILAMTVFTAQGAYRLTQDVPLQVEIALALPLLGILCFAWSLVTLFLNFGEIWNSSVAGVLFSLAAILAQLLFLVFLHYWKILGWRY